MEPAKLDVVKPDAAPIGLMTLESPKSHRQAFPSSDMRTLVYRENWLEFIGRKTRIEDHRLNCERERMVRTGLRSP
jgi:hypothetical protein